MWTQSCGGYAIPAGEAVRRGNKGLKGGWTKHLGVVGFTWGKQVLMLNALFCTVIRFRVKKSIKKANLHSAWAMKDEFFNGISPTCSAVPRVRSLLIKGLKWAVYPILLSCPSSSSSSVFWSAEQDRYDPFSSPWDDPENGDVELKILCPCVTAISSAGSGSGEQNIRLIEVLDK